MNKTKSKNRSKAKRKQNMIFALLFALGGVAIFIAVILATNNTKEVSQTNLHPEVSGSPRLQVDQEHIDFGDVPVGKLVSKTFTLTNVGDQTLVFTSDPYVEVVEGC